MGKIEEKDNMSSQSPESVLKKTIKRLQDSCNCEKNLAFQ